MKTKLTTILALLACGCVWANAQAPADAGTGQGPQKGPRGDRGPRRFPPELLEKYDTDKDGKLSPEEREALRKDRREMMEKRRQEMLEKFDADKDGKLSPEERKAAFEAKHKEMLEKYDTDKDGKLSPEERKAIPPEDRPMGMGQGGPGGRRGPGRPGGRPGPGGPPEGQGGPPPAPPEEAPAGE